MDEYFIAFIIVLVLLLVFIRAGSNARKNSRKLDGLVDQDIPNLSLPTETYDQEFTESTTATFDANDSTGLSMSDGVGGGDAPQLTENDVESPEYRRQMKTLIEHMMRIGYKKKIVNDYVNHIKDKHLSPQLILMQLKNDAHAPPPNVSN